MIYRLLFILSIVLTAASCTPRSCPDIDDCQDSDSELSCNSPWGDEPLKNNNTHCDCFGRDIWSKWRFSDSTWEQKIDADQLARAIIKFTTKMKRDWRLRFEDSRAYYTECTEKIRIIFSSQEILEICEAREMIVDVVENLLLILNADGGVRADLCHQPLRPEDLEIYINFESYFGEFVDPFYVGWLTLDEGLVSYYMFTLKQYYYDRWHARVEPYHKSKLFVEAQEAADIIYPEPIPEYKLYDHEEPVNISTTRSRILPGRGRSSPPVYPSRPEPRGSFLPRSNRVDNSRRPY